jgi:replicative DNA helicase
MANEIIELAVQYQRAGLQAIPSQVNKRPFFEWKAYQQTLMDEETLRRLFEHPASVNVGFICGTVSGGLEVIDVDCKYDLTGTLMQDLMGSIEDALPTLAPNLVTVKTPSGGYHLYYRCSEIEGNKKLAQRLPAESEPKEKRLVLIETRGEGGFIVAPPSTNYQLISGSFDAIPTITLDQRNIILAIARSFDMMPEEEIHPDKSTVHSNENFESNDDSPFTAYNQRGDVVAFLEQYDWKFVKRQGDRIHLKRPGKTDTETSGNFHEGKRKFFVFSSSTEFEPQKAYSPSDVFILLECAGDKKLAARRLAEMGFGQIGARRKLATIPTQVKANQIRIEGYTPDAELINLMSSSQTIKIESIKAVDLERVYIYFVEHIAESQVLRAIEAIEAWTDGSDVKIFVRQVSEISSNDGLSLHTYEFVLKRLFRRYDELYTKNGGYLTAEQEYNFFTAIHDGGAKVKDPGDRERYRLMVLNFSEENSLGITDDTYRAKTDKIRYSRAIEAKKEDLAKLLEAADKKQETGNFEGVLDELKKGIQQIEARTGNDIFSSLLLPTSEQTLAEKIRNKPSELETGYMVGNEQIRFPAGAISLIAAPTNHGKTTFLINTILCVAQKYPEKSFYLFSFEEDAESVTITTLSAYIGQNISRNNRDSIRSYYRDGRADRWISEGQREFFNKKREQFFSELINTRRLSIRYVDYGSGELAEAIRYLFKHGNAGGVFIDYVQLLRKEGFKSGSRADELDKVCQDLKNVAVETGLPVVLGSQFNRDVVHPSKMHPTNIADSSNIEKVANCIVGFWNLNKKALPSKDKKENEFLDLLKKMGKGLYVEILKYRGGTTTESEMGELLPFDGNTGVISHPKDSQNNNNQPQIVRGTSTL